VTRAAAGERPDVGRPALRVREGAIGITPSLRLVVIQGVYAICRLGADEALPPWATCGGFSSVTRTPDELSIVCDAHAVPSGVRLENGWRAMAVQGPIDFALTGILAALAEPLAAAGISLFAVSTFDTDYILVRDRDLERALLALRDAGHHVSDREDDAASR
jgi:uncharacterized protein